MGDGVIDRLVIGEMVANAGNRGFVEVEIFVALDSSSTVSPEVRRPGSNKIMTLGGD